MTNRLLIIEPDTSGHRMNYVRLIVREAIERGLDVSVATREASAKDPAFLIVLNESGKHFQTLWLPRHPTLDALPNNGSDLKRHIYTRQMLGEFYHSLPLKPNSIMIPYLNHSDKAFAIFGSPFSSTPWSGLLMRDTFHHRKMGVITPHGRLDGIKERLFIRLLKDRSLRALFTIDEVLPEYIQRHYPLFANKLHYVPDPVEMRGNSTREKARKALGIPNNHFVILVFGAIGDKKGLDVLISATTLPDFPKNVILLIAGKQSENIRVHLSTIQSQKLRDEGRLIEINEYFNDEKEFALFRASDIVWVGYRGHYTSSGVLVQAAALGLPCIGCREGLIGWRIRKYGLGCDIDPSNHEAISQAVRFLTTQELSHLWMQNGIRMSTSHSHSCFSNSIMSVL